MGDTGLFRDETPMTRAVLGFAFRFPKALNKIDPDLRVSLKKDSAATLLRITEDPAWANHAPEFPGQAPYFDPKGKPIGTKGDANDWDKCKELWDDSAKILGIWREAALC